MAPLILGAGIELVKMFAPKLLGAVVGKKAEQIAQDFVDMAEKVTGEANPEAALVKLQTQQSFSRRMLGLVNEREKELDSLYLDDKADARGRDVKLRELGYENKRADIMLIGAYLILAAVIVALSGYEVNQAVQGILAMLAGGMLKAITDAFQFEFGSSRGSKEKSIHINSLGDK